MSNRPIRRFVDMLGLLNRGRFVEKLDTHLGEAMQALEALPGEKGDVTITVTVKLVYENGRYDVRPAVKSKLPEERHSAARRSGASMARSRSSTRARPTCSCAIHPTSASETSPRPDPSPPPERRLP